MHKFLQDMEIVVNLQYMMTFWLVLEYWTKIVPTLGGMQ